MTTDTERSAPAFHNRLAASKSPYLLQHARNPVDWHPWDEKAFDLARSQDKLIFLSIGYSTCHWCHVMAHECFEDEEVAALLNRDYVAIKVDREERPDIDQVYMDVCQRMTGSGGWPLTVFMTPDALPFYAATYIPKHGRRERPGLLQLLPLISDKWRQEPALLKTSGQRIVDAVAEVNRPVAGGLPDASIFDQAVQALQANFDTRHAGFGRAPKFPRPHDLCFLLRRYRRTGQAELLEMVERTLVAMRCGGIYDQLGFGFHRYAVDEAWLVPHFEKMLYDQAGLVAAYAEAFQVTGRSLFARTAREIIRYLKRDMMSPEGAFYSAEDADSEGIEGKFYVWNEAEIVDLLGEETADRFNRNYGVDAAGNFHDEATGMKTGANILHLPVPDLRDREAGPPETLSAARQRLFDARARRVRPHRDDKIVTAWNGMIVSALARAGRILEEPHFLEDADRVVSFLMSNLRTADGRLLRCYRDGAGDIGGFAEDYAYFIRGLLDLFAADFRPGRLLQARALAAEMTRLFLDEGSGILYDTAIDADSLVVRPHSFWDGAMPAAGSVAMEVYLRLFQLTGDSDWRSRAESVLAAAAGNLARYPAGCTHWLQSAAWLLEPTREVVVAGQARSPAVEAMLAAAARPFAPETAILFRPEPLPDDLRRAAPFLAAMTAPEEKVLAYVCRNESCQAPLADPDTLQKLLGAPP